MRILEYFISFYHEFMTQESRHSQSEIKPLVPKNLALMSRVFVYPGMCIV